MNRDLVLALHRLGESISGVFSSPFPLQKRPEVSPLQEQDDVQFSLRTKTQIHKMYSFSILFLKLF